MLINLVSGIFCLLWFCCIYIYHFTYIDWLLASIIFCTSMFGDCALKSCDYYVARALVDNTSHGLIGAFSWSIVTAHNRNRYNKQEVIVCGILATLVDVDHFLKAKSLKLKDALQLNQRALFHCSTLPLLILVIGMYISIKYKSDKLFRYVCLIWTSFSSHHVRDANRRGLWFFPVGSTVPLRTIDYILLILILPYFTLYLMDYICVKSINTATTYYTDIDIV